MLETEGYMGILAKNDIGSFSRLVGFKLVPHCVFLGDFKNITEARSLHLEILIALSRV